MIDQEVGIIHETSFYMLIHNSRRKALHISHRSPDCEKQLPILAQPNQNNLGEVWMFIQTNKDKYPGMYEIVHAASTLVLTKWKPDQIQLSFGKQKAYQFFHIEQNQKNKLFTIQAEKGSHKFIVFGKEGLIETEEQNEDERFWEIVKIKDNDIINHSCIIENPTSLLVLDVPRAKTEPGVPICQYAFNNRFNQRWRFIKITDQNGDYYMIQNLRSHLFLDIKGAKDKKGAHIIQWNDNKGLNQRWKVENYGNQMYLIRSLLNPNLLLSIGNKLGLLESVHISEKENQSFWRIIGHLPS